MFKEYLELIKQYFREIRKIHHDMNDHMNVVNAYLSMGQYAKVKEYV